MLGVLFIDFVFLGVFGYHPVSSMVVAIYLLSFFGLSCALPPRQRSLHPLSIYTLLWIYQYIARVCFSLGDRLVIWNPCTVREARLEDWKKRNRACGIGIERNIVGRGARIDTI